MEQAKWRKKIRRIKTKKNIPIDIEKRIKKSRQIYIEKRKIFITNLERLQVYTFFENQLKEEITKKEVDLILLLKTRTPQANFGLPSI